MTDGYSSMYPSLSPPSAPYRPPPPYNPAYRSFPAPHAPAAPSWLSSLTQPAVYLPLLKVCVGLGVTGCVCYLAYRAGQRSQRLQRGRGGDGQHAQPPRPPARVAEERKVGEEDEEALRRRWRAAAGGPAGAGVDWLDVLLPASPSSSDAISPAVRRSLRRTCVYLLSGLGITGGTIAYLTLLAPRSSSLSAVLSSLSSHQTRLLAFLTTVISALAVQLLSKRHVRAKHTAFLLFHLGSGVTLAPFFFLPSAIVLRAALATTTILASTVALTLSSRTRSSLWLYSPFVVGSSLLLATGLYDLIRFFSRSPPPAPTHGLTPRGRLVIVASVLLFAGYVVLDLQKLIAVSQRMERERRRRAVEDAGLAGPAGPPPPDDDDEDEDRPRRPFFARPPPYAPGWDGGEEGGNEEGLRRRPLSVWGTGEKRQVRGDVGGRSVAGDQAAREEVAARVGVEESWVSSELHPDHMALAIDLYLDAANIFVQMIEWYSRAMQQQQQREQQSEEGEADDHRPSSI